MRVYYVRLTNADFYESDGVWTTKSSIDLYDNASYRNYSTTKSAYGLNSLGDGTWTGLSGSTPSTDSGIVEDGRFIDTSGRIDIVSYNIGFSALSGTDKPVTKLSIASGTIDATPDFHTQGPYLQNETIDHIDSDRYINVLLEFEASVDLAYNFELYIRVEIDKPVMAPLYRSTKRMLNKFPEWMAIRELYNETSDTATPITLGGKVINALAGEWVENVDNEITYQHLQHFIETIDTNQIVWCYKSALIPDKPYAIRSDPGTIADESVVETYFSEGQEETSIWGEDAFIVEAMSDDTSFQLARASSLLEFYEGQWDDICYWDEQADVLYTTKLYNKLLINGVVYAQEPHHVWGPLDDIGLTVDLPRLYLEDNVSYKARVLDVYINKPGVGLNNFKLALRRELDLWRYWGSTPNSQYMGATPEVLEISDLELDNKYMTSDGLPTQRFISLADELAREYPTTWGRFVWNQAIWDIGGELNEGFTTLPYRLDATPLLDADTQSGVGDGSDLVVIRPNYIPGAHDFDAKFTMRGRHKVPRQEYTPVEFDIQLYGQADRKFYNNPVNSVWLTVEIETNAGGNPVYVHAFEMKAQSNVDAFLSSPSPASYAVFRFLSETGVGTSPELVFVHKLSGAVYNDFIPSSDIKTITLKHGKWNVGSQTYTNLETSNTFDAWFSSNDSEILTFNSGTVSYDNDAATPSNLLFSTVVMKSKLTNYTVQKWQSAKFQYKIILNTTEDRSEPRSKTVYVPSILWAPGLESTPNKEIIIEFLSANEDDEYGAQATKMNLDALFIPMENITVNGVAWTDPELSMDDSTSTIEFACESAPNYPVDASTWNLVEYEQIGTVSGTVDENGPWRDGTPPTIGNANFKLATINLSRADFGVPETDDYVMTWLGVEVLNDPQVIAWLESNTIKPLNADNITYPANAIVEEYDYTYTPFILNARLRLEPSPPWNPQVHSGWFFQGQQEYYLYADKRIEAIASATPTLTAGAYQGAPIIVFTDEASPRELRQVAFVDGSSLSLTNTQVVKGTGEALLYLAYPDVYDVTVTNLNTGATVDADTSTTSNILVTDAVTSRSESYEVTYKLTLSFYVDHESIVDGEFKTKLVFDQPPAAYGATSYNVSYEGSRFNPATPVDLPLNPLFTTVDDGFIFISYNEYTLDRIEVHISPTKLVADGEDYLLVSIHTLDRYGNPKPNQEFTISATFGTFDASNLTTNDDGFAVAILTADVETSTTTGTITILDADSDVQATASFEIEPASGRRYRLLAIPGAEMIPADGIATNVVFGKVEDPDFEGVAYAEVRWKRARSLYELFATTPVSSGTVVANAEGVFTVGPFTAATPAAPGYWFLASESDSASPSGSFDTAGDVVFWYEYPDALYGVENFTGLPRPSVQQATPLGVIPTYSYSAAFPAYYDEATPSADATPIYGTDLENYLPPNWYALPMYVQYQLGLLGSTPNTLDLDVQSRIRAPRNRL